MLLSDDGGGGTKLDVSSRVVDVPEVGKEVGMFEVLDVSIEGVEEAAESKESENDCMPCDADRVEARGTCGGAEESGPSKYQMSKKKPQ